MIPFGRTFHTPSRTTNRRRQNAPHAIRSLWRFVVVVAVCSIVTPLASAQSTVSPVFAQAFALPTSSGFSARFAVGDVAGNACPDIVTVRTAASTVTIDESLTGGVAHVAQAPFAVAPSPIDVALGDLDGDLDLDIVTLNASQVSVLLRVGTAFLRTDYPLVNASAQRLTLCDIDGDGDLDCLRGSVVSLNSGTGTLAAPVTLATVNGAPFPAEIGDFDGDSDFDLVRVVSGPVASTIEFFANSGIGAFAAPVTSAASGALATAAAVADLNGDGRDDLVLHQSGIALSASLTTHLAQANGTFAPVPAFPGCFPGFFATAALPPVVADFDGDLDLDVFAVAHGVVNEQGSLMARVWRNDGSGQLSLPQQVEVLESDQALSADLDLDGDRDILTTVLGSVRGYFNQGVLSNQTNAAVLSILSGDNQSADMTTGFGQPLIVRLTDSTGTPIPGTVVSFEAVGGSSTATLAASCAATDANGTAVTWATAGVGPGAIVITARASSTAVVAFSLTVMPISLSIVSGNNQGTSSNSPFPQPLVLLVLRSNGQAYAQAPVTFSAGTGVSVALSATGPAGPTVSTFTDAFGRASVIASADPTPSSFSTVVSAGLGLSLAGPTVAFSLSIQAPPTLVRLTAPSIGLDVGDATEPMICELRDGNNIPIPNLPVSVTVSPFGFAALTAPVPLQTDAFGRVSVTATTSATATGLGSVSIVVPSLSIGTVFTLFARRLTVSPAMNGLLMNVHYRHESGPQALVLAVDFPLPSPGFVSSPFGAVATSILSPMATLFVADTFGAFGIPDPGLVANPVFFRSYVVVPGLTGFSFVVQIYGFDPDEAPDFSRAVFVSNPVTVNL